MGPPPPRKRRKVEAVEEVVYDPEARQEYLTGFHKRKVARQKLAQEIAAKKEREAKIEDRRTLREQRARDLENHVNTVNAMLRAATDADSDEEPAREKSEREAEDVENDTKLDEEAEYIDEDKYTTVTIGEMNDSDEETLPASEEVVQQRQEMKRKAEAELKKQKRAKQEKAAKKKKKKFRYEAPAERRIAREKLKVKKSAAAKTRRESKR